MTHVATWRGFVSVAFLIDAFARRIVGWRRRRKRTAASSYTEVELEIPVDGRVALTQIRRTSDRSVRAATWYADRGVTSEGRPSGDDILEASAAHS